jgi:hypothetical protein
MIAPGLTVWALSGRGDILNCIGVGVLVCHSQKLPLPSGKALVHRFAVRIGLGSTRFRPALLA